MAHSQTNTPPPIPPGLDFPGREILTPSEIADRLGISRQQIHRLITLKKITVVDISAGDRPCYRITIDDYHKFLLDRLETGVVNPAQDNPATLP